MVSVRRQERGVLHIFSLGRECENPRVLGSVFWPDATRDEQIQDSLAQPTSTTSHQLLPMLFIYHSVFLNAFVLY